MESLERLLREHPFLRDLGAEPIGVLVGCAKNLRFSTGDLLLAEGGAADTFYLLREGKVSLEVMVPGKGAFRLETLGPGDVLGWSWLFPPHRWQLDARAVEPVLALAFDGACLRGKMDLDHDLGYGLAKLLLYQVYQRLLHVRLQRLDLYRTEP